MASGHIAADVVSVCKPFSRFLDYYGMGLTQSKGTVDSTFRKVLDVPRLEQVRCLGHIGIGGSTLVKLKKQNKTKKKTGF